MINQNSNHTGTWPKSQFLQTVPWIVFNYLHPLACLQLRIPCQKNTSAHPTKFLLILFVYNPSSLSHRYWDLPCSEDEQEDPGGEILSTHQTCDLELSSSICQAFFFTFFFWVKTENPPLLFCILICHVFFSHFFPLLFSSHSTNTSPVVHVFGVCVCMRACVHVCACAGGHVCVHVWTCVCDDMPAPVGLCKCSGLLWNRAP